VNGCSEQETSVPFHHIMNSHHAHASSLEPGGRRRMIAILHYLIPIVPSPLIDIVVLPTFANLLFNIQR
jgi:hypothetical protein